MSKKISTVIVGLFLVSAVHAVRPAQEDEKEPEQDLLVRRSAPKKSALVQSFEGKKRKSVQFAQRLEDIREIKNRCQERESLAHDPIHTKGQVLLSLLAHRGVSLEGIRAFFAANQEDGQEIALFFDRKTKRTPLTQLIGNAHLQENTIVPIARELLKQGASVDDTEYNTNKRALKVTPLMLAVMHKMEDLAQALIDGKADPSIIDYNGQNVYDYIDGNAKGDMENACWDRLRILVGNAELHANSMLHEESEPCVEPGVQQEFGPELGRQLFDLMGRQRIKLAGLDALLDSYSEGDVLEAMEFIDANTNRTLLMQLIRNKHISSKKMVAVLETLISEGVDVNLQVGDPQSPHAGAEPRGKTALMIATARGLLPVVKSLIFEGANSDLQDAHGRTVYWAVNQLEFVPGQDYSEDFRQELWSILERGSSEKAAVDE